MRMTISRLKNEGGIPVRTIVTDMCRDCGSPCEWFIKDGNYISEGCPNALCPRFNQSTGFSVITEER